MSLGFLRDELDKVLVDLGKVLLALFLFNLVALLGTAHALLGDHDDAGRALSAAGGAELGARRDEDVGDVDILTEHGDMADDIHGADITGEDDDAREGSVAWARGGRFPQGLDDFFYAALEGLVLCRCGERITR